MSVDSSQNPPATQGLLEALARLDERLSEAFEQLPEVYGAHAVGDPLRGLTVTDEDVQAVMARSPGEPAFRGNGHAPLVDRDVSSALTWLAEQQGLDDFALDALLIALAPEIDLRYERLFGYLQDDVTRRRPSVSLLLDLLCGSAEERLSGRRAFSTDADLITGDLVTLEAPEGSHSPPLLAYQVRVDPQVVRFVLGEPVAGADLAPYCRLVRDPKAYASTEELEAVTDVAAGLMRAARSADEALAVHLTGASDDLALLAREMARKLELPLLEVDLSVAAESRPIPFGRILRQAWFSSALPFFHGLDALVPHASERRALSTELGRERGWVLLSSRDDAITLADPLTGSIPTFKVRLGTPGVGERRELWKAALAAENASASKKTVEKIASSRRISRRDIARAAGIAKVPLSMDTSGKQHVEILQTAARAGTRGRLAGLATRLETPHEWDDLILSADTKSRLEAICRAVRQRSAVMETWGFGAKLSTGKGLNVLFSGPSGTGKTMAAGVIARTLGLDLFRVELANVVSKYIGETEKNLQRLFDGLTGSDAVLLFDEADALFGKRSEVKDAHDRYANLEISYVLQKMEQLDDGLCILSTNLPRHLDTAFQRRLAYSVSFAIPEAPEREAIWEGMWPEDAPREGGIRFDRLAERFVLTGGSIKNVVLAAAVLAAEAERPVREEDLLNCVQGEFEKMGKLLVPEELDLDGPV